MRFIITLYYLVLIVLGISFAALNASAVTVHFYFSTINIPISILIMITLGVGIVLGVLIFLSRYWRLKSEHRKIKQRLQLMEKEIKNLRSIPLNDS
jgi:putative membrane protein